MEIVQTCTVTWRWCMSMFGARFAVFVRRACVLPTPCPATRNLSFWSFHRHRHPVVSTRCFTGLVRVGVKIPQDPSFYMTYIHTCMSCMYVVCIYLKLHLCVYTFIYCMLPTPTYTYTLLGRTAVKTVSLSRKE